MGRIMKGVKDSSGSAHADIRQMIVQSRSNVAMMVNVELTSLYWNIGHRIKAEILKNRRAAYGDEILSTLSRELVQEFGDGFSYKSLNHMVRFYEAFPDGKIVSTLSRQLSWSHFKEIFYLEDGLKRQFYAEMCRVEKWSVRQLRDKIDGMLYERTAISRKPDALIAREIEQVRKEEKLTPDMAFRDPYLLSFLGLKDVYSEKDLEMSILRELELFILELGAGFTFVARQKRITVDQQDHYIDLLFYHRLLRRLIVIELKITKFKAEYKGQMELYLRWLEKNEMQPGEEPPLGLILCAGKSDEQVELLQLDKSGIRVAQYLTTLPPRELLESKLHQAVNAARQRMILNDK